MLLLLTLVFGSHGLRLPHLHPQRQCQVSKLQHFACLSKSLRNLVFLEDFALPGILVLQPAAAAKVIAQSWLVVESCKAVEEISMLDDENLVLQKTLDIEEALQLADEEKSAASALSMLIISLVISFMIYPCYHHLLLNLPHLRRPHSRSSSSDVDITAP